jgi:hypothetical protein
VYAPDPAILDRIRSALGAPSALRITDPSRFYSLITAESTKVTSGLSLGDLSVTSTVAPGRTQMFAGGGGIDLLQLLHRAVEAQRRHEAARIRARIDRELQALAAQQQ